MASSPVPGPLPAGKQRKQKRIMFIMYAPDDATTETAAVTDVCDFILSSGPGIDRPY